MPLRNILPLQILWQHVPDVGMLNGVYFGIWKVLSLAGVANEIKVESLEQRRQPDWLNQNGMLIPYQSLDWHIELARQNSKRGWHLNSVVLLDSLKENPTYKTESRYELVVVNEPLHWNDASLRTVSGIGRKGRGAIITVGHYLHLLQPVNGESDEDKKKRQFAFLLGTQMLTMHELGHIFGLHGKIGANPTDEERKKAHCLNECVMYWQESEDLYRKITGQPFCPSCLEKLKQFFIEP